MSDTKCYCGKPLHYTDERLKEYMQKLIAEHGEYATVTCLRTDKKYKVQRHYIALHSIKGHELAGLGFEEVRD